MDTPVAHEQQALPLGLHASSLVSLLEHGLARSRQGHYDEGATYFMLAREQLSANQASIVAVLDALIQSCAVYHDAEQALLAASKRFANADTGQQACLSRLEGLLPGMQDNTSGPTHGADQACKNTGANRLSHILPLSPAVADSEKLSYQPVTRRGGGGEDEGRGPLWPPPPGEGNGGKDADPHHGWPLPALYIACFGRFEVRRLGKPVTLCSSRNGRAILRYLIAQPGYSATTDTLMAILWPEDEPEVAQNKLHIAVSALRRALNSGCPAGQGRGYIMCENRIYQLNPQVPIQTDVDEFLECYRVGQQTGEKRLALYERACHLYTGPFLSEDLYADWSFLQREQFSQIHIRICKVLADHYLKLNRYEEAAKWAAEILKQNRCDEVAHRQLMQIHAMQGNRAEVVLQYQRCEHNLGEELGVRPLPETIHLFQQLLTNEFSSHAALPTE